MEKLVDPYNEPPAQFMIEAALYVRHEIHEECAHVAYNMIIN